MAAVLDPFYSFVWQDADHPGDEDVKWSLWDTMTNEILREAEFVAQLLQNVPKASLKPLVHHLQLPYHWPSPAKKLKSTLCASYEKHIQKAAAVTK